MFTKEIICPPDKIRNPATGRCVLRTGKIGKSILSQQSVEKLLVKKRSPCPSGKIRNPATGRCVSKTGMIARNIMKIPIRRKSLTPIYPADENYYNLDEELLLAIDRNNPDMVVLLFEKGADNFGEALTAACEQGNVAMAKLVIDYAFKESFDYQTLNFEKELEAAAFNGYINIVNLMLDEGANNIGKGIIAAASGGHENILYMLLAEYTVRSIDNSRYVNIDYQHDIIEKAFAVAAMNGHNNIVKLLINEGASNFNEALKYAKQRGHITTVKLIQTYIKQMSK